MAGTESSKSFALKQENGLLSRSEKWPMSWSLDDYERSGLFRFAGMPTGEPVPPGPSCPSLEEFGKYEAGLQPEEKAAAILGHVAECPDCAGLLAEVHREGSDMAWSGGQP